MIYDVLEKKLFDANIGLSESNVFREYMPADIKSGVLIRSPLSGIKIDPNIPGWYKPRLQMIVRHHDIEAGINLAGQVVKAVRVEKSEIHEQTENGRVRVAIFTPEHLPIQFPRSDGNGIEWSINFTTAFAFISPWQM